MDLTGNFDYTCNVTAGGLPLGEHTVGVLAETTVPEFVEPGMVISSRDVGITLTMPELLRNSTVGLLGGVAASGASTDSTITLTTGGQTQTVPIPSLAADRTPIPQVVNEPWLIPAAGATPEIPVPAYAVDKVDMGMPASFSIVATVYKADDSTVEAALSCVGPADLALGSIPVGRDSVPTDGPTTAPTDGPTTAPTDGPTTAPTDGPTTAPTDGPTTAPTDGPTTAPTDDPAGDPIIDAPSVASPGDVITFTFATEWIGTSLDFELHSDPIALGTKTVDELGEASVRIPRNAPLGDHTIKVLSDGQVIASVPIEIVAADGGDDSDEGDDSSDGGYLASAGGPTLTIAALGGLLVLAGAGVMTLRRTPRRD